MKVPPLTRPMSNNMPRQSREKSDTGIYHVMLRGINRQDIFEDEEDYRKMILFLRGLVERTDDNGLRIQPSCLIYSYCLMSNHLHLLVKEKGRRDEVLRSAKLFGAGIRQLSRLTGVSFGVIQKI